MARLKSCRVCKNPVSTSAKACPLCGAKNPSTTVGEQFGGLVVLAIIAAVVWFACFNDTGDEPAARPATTTTTTTTTVGLPNTTKPATTAMSNAGGFATPTTPTLATVTTTALAVTTTAIPANPGDIVSCADFATWKEAQDWFDTYAPHYGDVAFMDGNDNGVACEKLLPEGVTVAEVLASQQTTTTTAPTTTTTTRLTTTTTHRPTTTTTSTGEAEALFIWQIAVDATQGLLDLTNDEAVTFGYAACADLRRESVADVFLLYGLLFGETDGGILIRHATTWLCPELRDYVSREVDRLLGY